MLQSFGQQHLLQVNNNFLYKMFSGKPLDISGFLFQNKFDVFIQYSLCKIKK